MTVSETEALAILNASRIVTERAIEHFVAFLRYAHREPKWAPLAFLNATHCANDALCLRALYDRRRRAQMARAVRKIRRATPRK